MTDTPQDRPENRHVMDQEAFKLFLAALSPEEEEAARLYTKLHQKLVGFFNFKGLTDPVSAADESIDRAAVKLRNGAHVPDMEKYCLGIARFIVKERLRHAQREHLSFFRFTETLADSSDEQVERIYRVLKPCFEQLTEEERDLLVEYCKVLRGRERAEHRRQLALKRKTTVLALRMRVTRLRDGLSDCVKKLSYQP